MVPVLRWEARAGMSQVLLVSWEAADWRLLRPLMEQGRLPHLRELVSRGISGDLGMILPRLAPATWTSAVTGRRAHQHRVLGSGGDPTQRGGRVFQRQGSALWNILDRSGLSSVVVGWPVTDPAESTRGVMVSDRFIRLGVQDPVEVPRSGLQPSRLLGRISDLLVSPERLAPGMVQSLISEGSDAADWPTPTLDLLRTRAAELSTTHALAMALAQWEPWDFMAVHYPGLLVPGVSDRGSEPLPGIPDGRGCPRLSGSMDCLDRMLGTLVQLVGPETRTVVVAGGLVRPDPFESIPSLGGLPILGTSIRERGILAMAGPGIRKGASVVGASILDITPTVLQTFGLPVGGDMAGCVLPVFEEPPRVTYVPGWGFPIGTPVSAGALSADPAGSGSADVALPEIVGAEERYHLACDLMDCGRWSEAAQELKSSWKDPSADLRNGLLLMRCRLLLRQHVQARQTFDELLVRLRDADSDGSPSSRNGSGRPRLDQNALWYLEADLLELEGQSDAAMGVYRQMLHSSPPRSRRDLHLRLAEGFLRRGERIVAIQHYLAACSIDPQHVPAFIGLGRAYLLTRRFQEAVAEARRSIELDPANPNGHFLHGVALVLCGHPDWAVESLEEVVRQSSALPQAHRRLARIYQRQLNNPAKARHHLRLFRKARGAVGTPADRRPGGRRAPTGSRQGRIQGRMAKARTGKPSPPSGLGHATTISAPIGGT